MGGMNVRIRTDRQLQADVAANDSDKSFTVPGGVDWRIKHVRAELTTTAAAGNRRVVVEIQDASLNVLARIQAGIVQAASTTVAYNFAPGLADQTVTVNGDLNTALADLRLNAGEIIRVYDIAAVDAAADDMDVRIMLEAV